MLSKLNFLKYFNKFSVYFQINQNMFKKFLKIQSNYEFSSFDDMFYQISCFAEFVDNMSPIGTINEKTIATLSDLKRSVSLPSIESEGGVNCCGRQ